MSIKKKNMKESNKRIIDFSRGKKKQWNNMKLSRKSF